MPDLSSVQFAFILSFLAGASSLLGASLVFAFHGLPLKRVALGLGFSAGIMIYLSFFELLPESFALTGEKFPVVMYFAVGALLAYILDAITHYLIDREDKHDDNIDLIAKETGGIKCSASTRKAMASTGVFVAIALGAHNLPEGVITFTSAMINPYFGLTMALAVAIHNIPEGFCVALPVYCATGSKVKGMIYATIAGLAEPLGALLAWLALANFSDSSTTALILGVVAGIMFYVAVDGLIPASRKLGHEHLSIFGVIAGFIFMCAVIFLLGLIS